MAVCIAERHCPNSPDMALESSVARVATARVPESNRAIDPGRRQHRVSVDYAHCHGQHGTGVTPQLPNRSPRVRLPQANSAIRASAGQEDSLSRLAERQRPNRMIDG